MSSNTPTRSHHHEEKFPWKHIIGYVLSLVLTFAAIWFVLDSHLPSSAIISAIVILAVFQAVIQLFMFMHLTEAFGPNYQQFLIFFAMFIAFTVVAGSIWIMAFKSYVA
ncbi:cytochrome aa3 quinol oxidase subunit IV [Alicyclobacillus tolerans]|uniref:Quinol oxidase subunit 4 n=2 Tax=Alicyclobacillus tolerans TaxID=90970 RepID=A0ABT9LXU2_9BACL|nr:MULTISPECIES: cytochrome aa3 quinol oxidase subunit IV [Alicyclobacillus]MDP9729097.1 cytochrome aa3 quinol oxidase subunit IV [Alicyclobacillus tengchongensis]QRF24193.1 cytochrome aa3 quinol oxidase subunit IV [Alicyclobacillus sp. TC]SHK87428.1 cytochrome aa3 quinol oxidase subunit 4 [Alicyclobacillus montanus]